MYDPLLVERLAPVILAHVRRVLARQWRRREPDLARELAHEVWVDLIDRGGKKLRAYDPARGASLERYVGVIAEHKASHVLQKQRAEQRGGDQTHAGSEAMDEVASPAPDPEQLSIGAELAAAITAHLRANLSERGRIIFGYLYVDGRTPDEIAAILGVDKQVVYNWRHKIRRLAREVLDA